MAAKAEPRAAASDERDLFQVEIGKLIAETVKIGAETAKIQTEQRYYPMVALGTIAVGVLGALITLVVVVIKLAF